MGLGQLRFTALRRISGLMGQCGLLSALMLCLAFALGASTAFAGSAHTFSKSFGSEGPEAGEMSSPQDVAVDNSTGPASGDVYVADTGNHRVDQFDAEGNFIRAWGWGVADGLPKFETCTLICEQGIAGSGPGQFRAPSFIAVDGSSGLSAGDVYVGDRETTLVQKFSSTGELVASWGDSTPSTNGQLAGTNATNGPFGGGDRVAIDTSGNLWVDSGGGEVFEFDQSGGFIQSWTSTFSEGRIAIDGSDNVYYVRGIPVVEKLSPSGAHLGEVVQDGEFLTGLTVDQATGELYVDEGGHSIQVVDSPCEPSATPCHVGETFGSTHLTGGTGLAVNSSSETVYAADSTSGRVDSFVSVISSVTTQATNIKARSMTVNGTVNPEGSPVSDCHFEYGTTTLYGHSAPCEGSPGSGTTTVPVHAQLNGLEGGTVYHVRLTVTNGKGSVSSGDAEEPTLPVPTVDAASVANLTRTTAELTARINPHGVPATYYFEWGPTTAYGHVVPALAPGEETGESIGAGTTDKAVSQQITELEENRTYHWRIVAHNENDTTITVDHTFVYGTNGTGLPDDRSYEMVTPPSKNGALIGNVAIGTPLSIAENGDRLIGTSIQCFAGSLSCNPDRANEGEPFEFTRTAGGWVASALAPPATQLQNNTYWAGSADAGSALFTTPTPPDGEDDWYIRKPDGSLRDAGPVTQPSLGAQGVVPLHGAQAATADFSHIVWTSLSVWPALDSTYVVNSLYEYVGDSNTAPILVGVSGGAGSNDLISQCGTQLGGSLGAVDFANGSLSEDGSVVYFTPEPCEKVPVEVLYARIDESRTVTISQRSPTECKTAECENSPPGNATFQGASADGSKVFFTSTQKLTDKASENNGNLYEYDFNAAAGHNLIAVSEGDSSGQGPEVQGVVAISADGSHVYFVARGILSSEPNNQGQSALGGGNNLYVFERGTTDSEGHTAFVATLPEADSGPLQTTNTDSRSLWMEGVGAADVTPDGRFLVFSSHGALTRDATRTDGAQQVFRYDAQTGELVRISIGNDGFNDDGNAGFGDARIAVPSLGANRRDPTMSHDGSDVFFQSQIGLTPGALDDVQIGTRQQSTGVGGPGEFEILPVYAQNVYEYHDGHVYLISDGRDTEMLHGESDVHLEGSDATGTNVFFSTSDQLVPTDTDTQLDYYDARICSAGDPCIAPTPPALPPCLGEACHGTPPATPLLLAPGSASFSGQGNLGSPEAKRSVKVEKKKKPSAKRRKRKKKNAIRKRVKRVGSAKRLSGSIRRSK